MTTLEAPAASYARRECCGKRGCRARIWTPTGERFCNNQATVWVEWDGYCHLHKPHVVNMSPATVTVQP